MNSPKIIAQNKEHLKNLIENEIKLHGNNCNLNHIDVSEITDMNYLFQESQFNGDISKWDVSNVTTMNSLFFYSKFNGDISKWDVSQVKYMGNLFSKSKFNGDISKWDVSSVINMNYLFFDSQFNGDISKWNVSQVKYMNYLFASSHFNGDVSEWKPLSLIENDDMYFNCSAPQPYWSLYNLNQGNEKMLSAINSYHLAKKLDAEIELKEAVHKKIKI